MARDTDRKMISEQLRLHPGSWVQRWTSCYELTISNDAGRELNITYSPAGRVTHVTHWEPDPMPYSNCAMRTPIEQNKRQRVLDIILTKGYK